MIAMPGAKRCEPHRLWHTGTCPDCADGERDAVRDRLDGHEWRGGYYCECGHELNSPRGYLNHLADVLTRVPGSDES